MKFFTRPLGEPQSVPASERFATLTKANEIHEKKGKAERSNDVGSLPTGFDPLKLSQRHQPDLRRA
jgi:hypothetical protein